MTVLIIGASKRNDRDWQRWDPYVRSLGQGAWHELTFRLTRNLSFEADCLDVGPALLLEMLIATYQEEYQRLLQQYLYAQKYNWIITDRATTQGLVIDNPIQFAKLQNRGDNQNLAELFIRPGFLTNEATRDIGFFNCSILCLLMFELCMLLNVGGNLVFDTAYVEESHVNFLSSFFHATTVFDFNAPQNQVLKFKEYYDSGCYKAPRFKLFQGWKGRQANLPEIKKSLMDIYTKKIRPVSPPLPSAFPPQNPGITPPLSSGVGSLSNRPVSPPLPSALAQNSERKPLLGGDLKPSSRGCFNGCDVL